MPRPRSDDVPRDRVAAHALTLTPEPLPDEEYARMAGSIFMQHARDVPDPQVLVSRAHAVRLLGGIVVDNRHPLLGMHRAHLHGVHDTPAYDYALLTSAKQADHYHDNLVETLGEQELYRALHH